MEALLRNSKWKRELGKCDPLAPFLFLVVAEGLNGLLKQAVATNNYRPLKIGKEVGVHVDLLQFADDALFLGEACAENVVTLKCILRNFELVSGMKVNFHKSKLAVISIPPSTTNRFAAIRDGNG